MLAWADCSARRRSVDTVPTGQEDAVRSKERQFVQSLVHCLVRRVPVSQEGAAQPIEQSTKINIWIVRVCMCTV